MDSTISAHAGQATATPSATTGELTISSIRKNSEGPKPLRVVFRLDQRGPDTGDLVKGEPREADFSATEIETFGAFRRSVANRLGLWPSHCSERRGRNGRETWNLEIEHGFRKGAAP